jgi:hypothetical protein
MVFSLFIRSGEICFSTCPWRLSFSVAALGAGARWVLWSEDVGPEVVDLSFFPYFMGGMWWFLVQGSTGMFPGQRATSTCALLLAAGLFIDSQSLVGDGAFLDLAMEEARRLFQRVSWRCWSVAAAASFGECRKA